MLRVNQEMSFNDLLDIRAVIGGQLKVGTIKYYVGPIWEVICIGNNGAKKGVTLALKVKEGLENNKARKNTETVNTKEGF